MSRYLSTMTKLAEENARLRIQATITRIVYWSVLGTVVVVALMKYYGSM